MRFYSQFERLCQGIGEEEERLEKIHPIGKGKQMVFPEFDDVTIIFEQAKFEESEDGFELDEGKVLKMPYLDEARFFVQASKDKLLTLYRQETHTDDEGFERKGSSQVDDNYNYQVAFNWGFKVLELAKLKERVAKESAEPTEYDIQVETMSMPKRRYKRTWRPPRRR